MSLSSVSNTPYVNHSVLRQGSRSNQIYVPNKNDVDSNSSFNINNSNQIIALEESKDNLRNSSRQKLSSSDEAICSFKQIYTPFSHDQSEIFYNKVLGDTGLCTELNENALKSSDNFYVCKIIDDSEEKAIRPKKFKHLKNSYKSNDTYQDLSTQKKEWYKKLEDLLRKNKNLALKQQLKEGAKKRMSYDSLLLPSLGEGDVEKGLRDAYESEQTIASEEYRARKYSNPSSFIDIDNLTVEQSQLFKEYDGKLKFWYDDPNSVNKIINVISNVLSDPEKLEKIWTIAKENNSNKMFCRFQTNMCGLALNIDPKSKNLCYSRDFVFMCRLIWQEMINDIDNKTKGPLDTFFEENQEFIQEYCENQITEDIKTIKEIMKEQKQHSFARFCQLSINYENFVRHAKIIEAVAEKFEGGMGEQTRKIISELIEHSHYSPPKKEIEGLSEKLESIKKAKEEKKNELEQTEPSKSKDIEKLNKVLQSISEEKKSIKVKLKKLTEINSLLTVDDTHHNKSIMGYEEKGRYSKETKQNAVQKANNVMQLHGTSNEILNLQRAHTFPFPAMFNWKEVKMKEISNAHGIGVDDSFTPITRTLNANFFLKISKNSSVSLEHAKVMDKAFEKEIITIQKKSANAGEFLINALALLKEHHLKIFSETQFFPDFINQKLDQLSEWSTDTNNYKKCLAQCIRNLLNKDNVSLEDVRNELETYMEGTIQKIDEKNSEWENAGTTLDIIQIIGVIQIQQSYVAGAENVDLRTSNVSQNRLLRSSG